MTRRELLTAAAVLLGVGALVLAGHVADGGFYYDDWALSANEKYQGFWTTVNFYLSVDHRPLVALYLPLVQAAFGDNAQLQLAWIAVLHVGMCLCLYLFLRTVTIERLHAAAIALLVLVFPFSDASWLYVIGSAGTVAVSLYLLGSVAAIHGLRAQGRRAWVLHATAVLLYVASVVTYELALIAILVSGLLYALQSPHGPWRGVATRWAVDVGAMVLTVLLATSRTVHLLPGSDVHSVLSFDQQISHAKVVFNQGRVVLASSFLPFGARHDKIVLLGVAVLAVVAVLVRALLPIGDAGRQQLQRWLTVSLAALCGLVAAWLVLVPADPYYSPQVEGVGNRINTLAGICVCVLIYGAAMVLATLMFRGLPRWRVLSSTVAAMLAAFLAVGYLDRINADKSHWAQASTLAQRELKTIRHALPAPPAGSRVLLFRAPPYVAPGVPVFAAPWDLNGAVKLLWHNGSLSGYPVLPGPVPVCGAASVMPAGTGYDATQLGPYGTTFFVDAITGTALKVENQAQCARALEQITAGPG